MVVVFPAKVALNAAARLQRMWEAYWIGLFLGIGIGLGGIVAVLGGIILLMITGFATSAILVFAAGIIGIIGAAMKPPWWKFWKR